MSAANSARELVRQAERAREAVRTGDVEAALAIVGGRLHEALADLVDDLVRWGQVEDVTPERIGILLGLPADTIYNALRRGTR